jgi:hypothetical protein
VAVGQEVVVVVVVVFVSRPAREIKSAGNPSKLLPAQFDPSKHSL